MQICGVAGRRWQEEVMYGPTELHREAIKFEAAKLVHACTLHPCR